MVFFLVLVSVLTGWQIYKKPLFKNNSLKPAVHYLFCIPDSHLGIKSSKNA
jgi:hypothetical protein